MRLFRKRNKADRYDHNGHDEFKQNPLVQQQIYEEVQQFVENNPIDEPHIFNPNGIHYHPISYLEHGVNLYPIAGFGNGVDGGRPGSPMLALRTGSPEKYHRAGSRERYVQSEAAGSSRRRHRPASPELIRPGSPYQFNETERMGSPVHFAPRSGSPHRFAARPASPQQFAARPASPQHFQARPASPQHFARRRERRGSAHNMDCVQPHVDPFGNPIQQLMMMDPLQLAYRPSSPMFYHTPQIYHY